MGGLQAKQTPRCGAGWRIAVIGWGSLLWDPDGLETWAVRSADGTPRWRMDAGPALPLEFSRVSRKRPGALTLVVDGRGALCSTHVAEHAAACAAADLASALAMARADLARRERAPLERIAAVGAPQNAGACGRAATSLFDMDADAHGAAAAEIVSDWLTRSEWDGAVWTALPSNFEAEIGQAFSIEAAIAYLAGLDDAARREAVAYLENAPASAQTPLRRALSRSSLWARLVDARQRRISVT